MEHKHLFEANLSWSKQEQSTNPTERQTLKNHIVQIRDKQELRVSAAKAFKGDQRLYNPEDLLLSSLVSCHLMSYLYVCAQYQIDVIHYTDSAVATLQTCADGSGRITKVTLNPEVIISNPQQIKLATSLHQQAHKLCFIANSCNFPIQIQVNCLASGK